MNSVGKLTLTLAGLCALFSCGGGSGGGSVVSTTPTSTYVQQKPQVPNYANFANLALVERSGCQKKCIVVSNGSDELEYRTDLDRIAGIRAVDYYAVKINGHYTSEHSSYGTSNDWRYYSKSYGGPYFYLADVYYRDNDDGKPTNIPSAFYGRINYYQEGINSGYDWLPVEFLPVVSDAHWSWSNIRSDVQYSANPKAPSETANTKYNGEKIEQKSSSTGTIKLESNGHWSANFIDGDLKLDGAINGSDVSGESHFILDGQTINGKFIGSDGIRIDGKLQTGGAFAGSNEMGTQVYAGSWWNYLGSTHSTQ